MLPAAAVHGVGRAGLGAAGPRRAHRQVPARRRPADSRGASPHFARYVGRHRTEHAARVVEAVATAADGLGTSPLAVACAWARDRPGVSAVVVGARDRAQLLGSLAAEDLVLPAEIRSALDDVSARVGAESEPPAARRTRVPACRTSSPSSARRASGRVSGRRSPRSWRGRDHRARRRDGAGAGRAAPGDRPARRPAGDQLRRRRPALRRGRTAGARRRSRPAGRPGWPTRSGDGAADALLRRPVAAAGAAGRRGRAGRPAGQGGRPGRLAGTTRAAAGRWSTGRWPGSPGTGTPPRRVAVVADGVRAGSGSTPTPAIGGGDRRRRRRPGGRPGGLGRAVGRPARAGRGGVRHRRGPGPAGPTGEAAGRRTAVEGGRHATWTTCRPARCRSPPRTGSACSPAAPAPARAAPSPPIVALCRKVEATIALAAPTGRAAKRLEELAGNNATTMHRLLGARPAARTGRAGGRPGSMFDQDADNPIEADVVVVDEASMLDVELAAALIDGAARRHPPGDRRRPGAAAVDRAGPGARRPDRQRARSR